MSSNLNKSQREAVEYTDGPLLIVAGAGTGKTTVITQKIAYLMEKQLAKPEEILALTFTDKAAGEMIDRVDELLEIGYSEMQISTFHSFCQKILERYGLDIGLSNQFKLLTQTDAWLLVRNNFDKFDLDYYRPLGNPTRHIHELLRHFSKCKDELITPAEYLEYAEGRRLDTDSADSRFRGNDNLDGVKRLTEIANAYHTYNQLLLDNNSLDFGDLIFYTIQLLEKRPRILAALQKRFKYILVDEFQDVNWAQYQLVKQLIGENGQMTVVGDDDQCLPGQTKISISNGSMRIDKIRKGDEILTAVGKGYYMKSSVNEVKKKIKNAEFINIETEGGRRLELTDNHIVFCNTPQISDKKYCYVYIMQKKDWGWRMGITNDLAVRLRIERGGDRIIAIKTCKNSSEARFYETILSLQYNIPTVCFKERGNIQNIKWIENIYKAIDTNKNIELLAKDLNVDIRSHHYCLEGIKRGAQRRIKINLTMCHRNYGIKGKRKKLASPLIAHLLHIETSDPKAIDILQRNGYPLRKAKKGVRFRKQSTDLLELETLARLMAAVTGGIIEYNFKAAVFKKHTVSCHLMPAKNLQVGLYIPIFEKQTGIVLDRIKSIAKRRTKCVVYDLEITKTHNYIANDILVHNSIYAFRGASVSNIMRFKDDYPNAKEIVLAENYRSRQEILDLAYKSIQNNNPDRLEVKLKIEKRLRANTPPSSPARGDSVIHLHSATLDEEIGSVIDEIIKIKNYKEDTAWDDFAILVRANSHAEPFINAFEKNGIPYEFLSSAGLYRQPIVLDAVSFFRTITDYHESAAVYRLLRLPFLKFNEHDLQKISRAADKKSISLFTALKRAVEFGLSTESVGIIDKILALIHAGAQTSATEKPTTLLYQFLNDSGYLKYLTHEEERGNREVIRQIYHLKQFFDYIAEFEASSPGATARDFLERYEYILESGDAGKIRQPSDTPDSVNILTVHSAKGLEFKYVFVVNMVEDRFPSRDRGDGIEIPLELIKEQLPEGDSHLQEERRLFYVAMTRAKERLYLTSSDDYGGVRTKKMSRFLNELGYSCHSREGGNPEAQPSKATVDSRFRGNDKMVGGIAAPAKLASNDTDYVYGLPKAFSFSQIKSYETCPYQYKLSHILHIPTQGNASFSFGQTMHRTLQNFYQKIQEINKTEQGSLFKILEAPAAPKSKIIKAPSLDGLLEMYKKHWIEDWYKNQRQREDYYKKGEEILRVFYKSQENNWTAPVCLESWFKIKVGDYLVHGRIDRIDQLADGGLEIIDYKTGKAKEKVMGEDKDQLLIYQIAVEQLTEYQSLGKPSQLTYFYLNDNIRVSFLGDEKEKEKLNEKLQKTIIKIHSGDFTATPGKFVCEHCDFRDICDYRE